MFFAHNTPPITIENAIVIKVADIWHNGRLKSLDEINDMAPVQVSLVTYMRIAETVRFWDKKNMVPVDNVTGTSLVQFLSKFKKGSKHFRNVLKQHRVTAIVKIGCKALNSLMAALTIPVEYGAPVPVPVPGRQAETTIFRNKILESSCATCSDFTVELLKYMCLTNNFFHEEKIKSNCALSRRW
jgi:hypothetical protein